MCGSATDGPDKAEKEDFFDLGSQIFDHIGSDLLDLRFNVWRQVAIEESHAGLSQIVVDSDYNFGALLSDEISSIVQQLVKQFLKSVHNVFVGGHMGWNCVEPRVDQRLERQRFGLHIHHTASRNGSGRSNSQIFDFKHHGHARGQLNDLTRIQTQLLVVVKHCVHVFDPEGIHRAVEHNPVQFRRLIL